MGCGSLPVNEKVFLLLMVMRCQVHFGNMKSTVEVHSTYNGVRTEFTVLVW